MALLRRKSSWLTEPEPSKPEVWRRDASRVALCRHHGGLAQQRQRARLAAVIRGLAEQVRKTQPLGSRQPAMVLPQRLLPGILATQHPLQA